jgi:predicted lipid-binding transport protein (Tim44 family)
MKLFLKTYWWAILLALLLLGGLYWLLQKPVPPPPLSPAAEKAARAAIEQSQQQVGRDTTRAKAPAASAATNYEAGSAYAQVGKVLHQQSKPHAKPTIPSDTAAERLQRFFSSY